MEATPLAGQVALVTGASRGIGRALAIGLAEQGASIAASFRSDADGVQGTCRVIEEGGGRASSFQADVRSVDAVRALLEAVSREFGRVDVLVNNAALVHFGQASTVTKDDWDAVIETNLMGPFFATVYAAEAMKEQGGGSVVNISSCIAGPMLRDQSVYAISKAGLEAMTRALALEFAPAVRINAVAPGPTATDRLSTTSRDGTPSRWEAIPMGRPASTADLVAAVAFLASQASAFITGEILHVDGGWSLQGRPAGPGPG